MSDKLTRAERETIIIYNELDDAYIIDSSVQKHIRRFDKLGYECTDTQLYDDGTMCSKSYRVPVRAISFRSPEKRELTDEQREKLRERMAKMRSDK